MANSIDPDKMPHSAVSHLGLHSWGGRGGGELGKILSGTLNTPRIHIISRMTKLTYSYNLQKDTLFI